MCRMRLICLSLVLCFFLLPAAGGESLFPTRQGVVTDLAGVLDEETTRDLSTLSLRLQDETGGQLSVVTRHFLGGQDSADYARELFDAWELKTNDVLLLLVIGEERYALTLGETAEKALPAESRTALLGHFRTAYLNREYSGAAASLCLSLAETLARAGGGALNTGGLFGQAESSATPAPQDWNAFRQDINSMWQDMFGETFYEEETPVPVQDEGDSMNWRTLLIWGLVIYVLFFRKRRKYNFGHGPKKKRR